MDKKKQRGGDDFNIDVTYTNEVIKNTDAFKGSVKQDSSDSSSLAFKNFSKKTEKSDLKPTLTEKTMTATSDIEKAANDLMNTYQPNDGEQRFVDQTVDKAGNTMELAKNTVLGSNADIEKRQEERIRLLRQLKATMTPTRGA